MKKDTRTEKFAIRLTKSEVKAIDDKYRDYVKELGESELLMSKVNFIRSLLTT